MTYPTKERVPQQCTRIPPWRPGMWVVIGDLSGDSPASDLSGKVRRVRSLTCTISRPEQQVALWRVHFDDGRCVEARHVLRLATEAEAEAERAKARAAA